MHRWQPFYEDLRALAGNWDERGLTVRDELAAKIGEIRDRAQKAQREKKTLLVLGI